MKNQNRPQQAKESSRTKSILVTLIALVIFFMLLSSVLGLFAKYRAIRSHIKDLKQEESNLTKKKDAVTEQNKYLNTPEGKEQVFRDTYRLIKPGEGIVVITSDKEVVEDTDKKPGIQRFWESILEGLGLR